MIQNNIHNITYSITVPVWDKHPILLSMGQWDIGNGAMGNGGGTMVVLE